MTPVSIPAAPYSAEKLTVDGIQVIRLRDTARHLEVSVAPSVGNMTFELKANGHNLLYFPFDSVAKWLEKPIQIGIPFLGPWANRLSEDAFFANGKKYHLNPDVSELRRDNYNQPIHGLLLFARDWEVVSLKADGEHSEVTSRLEFWKHPDWMAQFPFAHTIEMTHRLTKGVLEVRLSIHNLSVESMPLVVGFHPWFQITDAPRDEWRVHVPVSTHYLLSENTIPTGQTELANLPASFTLAERNLDDVFGGVEHQDAFTVEGKSQKIAVRFGSKYPTAIVYAPAGRPFICFEPMSGITNGFNLHHAGAYRDLQSVAPGATWAESFWIEPQQLR
jgi:aldose 1-epimerase